MNAIRGRRYIDPEHTRTLAGFSRAYLRIKLRPYQLEAARAVIDSIREGAGRSIVILFSRQSGKDELCAVLKTFLLTRWQHREVSIVEVNPTYKPQTINAMERFDARLERSQLTQRKWRKRSDFIRYVGRARVTFLSGETDANVVGAVASMLLIVNEAQDVEPATYDRKFAPMAASTNATRLFMGTAWTSHTLLARELRAARQAEQADGIRRVFTYDAQDVRRVVPAYGLYVDEQVMRLGRGHPLVKTQYFNEEIDAQGGMFTAARRALMQCGSEPAPSALRAPPPNAGSARGEETVAEPAFGRGREGVLPIVFALDVAGQDEAAFHNPEEQLLRNPGRDSVTLTIAAVDLSMLGVLQAPIFRVLRRFQWTGRNHLDVFGKLVALADAWRPLHIIIDATGVGEGLWAMLDRRYPTRVIPVKFSAQKKSEIGYRFLAMIETGRFRDCSDAASAGAPEGGAASLVTQAMVDRQYSGCVSEVLLGPQRTMRWGVPEGTRDADGSLVHDDIVMADALLAEADLLDWKMSSRSFILQAKDPLEGMSHFTREE